MKKSISLFLFFSTLGNWPNAAWADGPLSGSDIRKLFPGTFHVEVAPTVSLEVIVSNGGRISGTTNKGDHDSGRWRVVGDKICVTFKRWLDHHERCSGLAYVNAQIKGEGFYAKRH